MAVPAAQYSLLAPGFDPLAVATLTNSTSLPASGNIFSVAPLKGYVLQVVTFIGAGTWTTCTFSLLASADGGTTWNSTADNNLILSFGSTVRVTDLTPGVCYKLVVSGFSGTSLTVNAVAAGA